MREGGTAVDHPSPTNRQLYLMGTLGGGEGPSRPIPPYLLEPFTHTY